MAYELFAGTDDRWANIATKKFHRLYAADPQLRVFFRTPEGIYDLPAALLAPHIPPPPIPRRVIFSTPDRHILKFHGTGIRMNIADHFVLAPGLQPVPLEPPDPLQPVRSIQESEWHRNAVARVAAQPELVVDPQDVVIRTWVDSVTSGDGVRLWKRLWTGKHPDVVFEHASGALSVIEIEPDSTACEGFAQVWGDYQIAFRVDRHLVQPGTQINGVLAVQTISEALEETFGNFLIESGIRIVNLD